MNLEFLDLTNYESNKAYVSKISGDSVDVNFIRLSIPNGVVRVVLPFKKYTHFRFIFDSFTYVAEITSIQSVANDLFDVYYKIDALKTFFEDANASYRSGVSFFCTRSNDSDLRNKWLNDPMLPMSDLYETVSGGTFTDPLEYDYVLVMSASPIISNDTPTSFSKYGGPCVYALGTDSESAAMSSKECLSNFWGYLLTSDVVSDILNHSKGDVILSQVKGLYLAPKVPDRMIKQSLANIYYCDPGTWGTSTWQVLDNCRCRLVASREESAQNAPQTIHTGVKLQPQSWLDLNPNAMLKMYHPLIGFFDVPLNHYNPEEEEEITFSLITDYVGGRCTIWSKDYTQQIATVSLPKIDLSCPTTPNLSQLLSDPLGNITGSLNSFVTGTESTKPMQWAGGYGYAAMAETPGRWQLVRKQPITSNTALFYNEHGYRVEKEITEFTEGKKYWLDSSEMLKGEKWYTSEILAAFERGFVY